MGEPASSVEKRGLAHPHLGVSGRHELTLKLDHPSGAGQYYTWNRPEQPDISMNRIVPVSLNYNRTVYVTRIEAEIISISNVTLVIFGVGALIVYVANSRPRNQETSNKSED